MSLSSSPLCRAAVSVSLVMLVSCSAAQILGDVARDATRQFLVGTATSNYGSQYTQDLERVIDSLVESGSTAPQAAQLTTNRNQVSSAAAGSQSAPANKRVPIELEVNVYRELTVSGRTSPVQVEDGDELRDGVGREGDGDNLKIQFRTNVACHVYAVWVDATAWASPIFPRSVAYSHANPVEAGRTYNLPAADQWFFLDGYRGVETLYFLASHEPLTDFESALDGLLDHERPLLPEGQAVAVPEPAPISRGLGGVRPGASTEVQASDGQRHATPSKVFVAQFPQSEIVVTRWFHHR